jgi:hypothetical protein
LRQLKYIGRNIPCGTYLAIPLPSGTVPGRTDNSGADKMEFLFIFAIVGIWFAVRGDKGFIGSPNP